MSVARIIVFALALTHAVGLADLVIGDSCEEQCTNDGCGKDCLPGLACRCHCPSAMPVLNGGIQAVAKLSTPREILHVPKRTV